MEQLLEDLTRGNVSQVKVVLASVAAALAVYQVVLMAVGYGKLRLGVLSPAAASWTHRAAGDAIIVVIGLVAVACIGYYGLDDDKTLHIAAGTALLVVLALKIAIIRWWHGLGRLLPLLGITVFLLLAVTWLTSAASYLSDD
jgi:hypothetical protein